MNKTKRHTVRFGLIAMVLALMIVVPSLLKYGASAASSTAKPGKVTLRSAKSTAYNKATIYWKKTSNATKYRVYYKQSGAKKWTMLKDVGANVTRYTHTSSSSKPLKSGKKYYYTVRAYNKYSKKWGSYNPTGKAVTVLPVPSKVKLASISSPASNKITIKWNKASNATKYRVYYKVAGTSKWNRIRDLSSRYTSYTHTSSTKFPLVSGQKYSYTVRAYNSTSRKWGSYDGAGLTVAVQSNATPTPAPTAIPKPTATPTPMPTATPIPKPTAIPKPTEAPKPTAAPQPTATPVPTATPQPTATPVPTATPAPTATPVPTATPAPTATPTPVKVSSISVSPSSLTLTSKGQTSRLTASVSPSNAANKSVTWSSSNTSVATVSADGTVTAVANGTASIYAKANDGSGVSAKCDVTVKVPNNIKTMTLAGGKSTSCYLAPEDVSSSIDLTKVTMEITGDKSLIVIAGQGYDKGSWCAYIDFTAARAGSLTITAKYNGQVLKQWNITITSDWKEYLGYYSWRKSVENQIWTGNMSLKDKLDAAQNYIKTHFKYKNGAPQYICAYSEGIADCFTASHFFGDFAKDAGAQVKYVSSYTGQMYDYISYAVSGGGHVFNRVLLNGQWVNYDAQPPLS